MTLPSGRGKRSAQTRLVNDIMKKNKHGKWTIDPDSRVLTEVNEKTHSRSRIQEDEAIPRVIMLAKCGGKAGFDEALNLGEIIEVETDQPGPKFYSYRKFRVGEEDKTSNNKSSSSKQEKNCSRS